MILLLRRFDDCGCAAMTEPLTGMRRPAFFIGVAQQRSQFVISSLHP
jgi:hypothetical protein